MKKIYVTMVMAALCSSASLFAQDAPAKKYFLGGTAGFSSTTNQFLNNQSAPGAPPVFVKTEGTATSFSIAPEFGFYIKQNIALGIKLGYTHTGGTDTYSTNRYNASPFVRFIVPIGNSRFSVYNDLGISAGYGKGSENEPGSSYGAESKTIDLGAFYEPGLQFRLKNNINLLATLGNLFYYNYNQKNLTLRNVVAPKSTSSSHYAGINSEFFALNSFRLGVNFLF